MAKKRAVILRLKTWAILRRIIRDYLAGRLTNRVPRGEGPIGGRGGKTLIGKPATAFTEGQLSNPDNVVNLWQGPAVTGDAATGKTKVVHYSTGSFATTDYVILTKINRKWYVSCFPGGGA